MLADRIAASRFRVGIILVLAVIGLSWSASPADAQRQQYKIQPDGTVLKLKRINVTTFQYVAHAKAVIRQNDQGEPIWYFKADTGKEYTAPAPDQPAGPTRYTLAQLNTVLSTARTKGVIPTEARVEYVRGVPMFTVAFQRNTLDLRWHAETAMSAQQYEAVNRTLTDQGYRLMFAEPYTDSERVTRFFAAWRR